LESLINNPDLLRDLLDFYVVLNFHVVQGEALTASDLEGRESVMRESVMTVEGREL
jgi:hypothetical protein